MNRIILALFAVLFAFPLSAQTLGPPGIGTSGSVVCLLSSACTFSGTVTAPTFVPNSSTAPSNGLYLPGANDVGLSAGSAKVIDCTTTTCTVSSTNLAAPIMTATSGAFGGCTIGSNGLCVTGTANVSGNLTVGASATIASASGTLTMSAESGSDTLSVQANNILWTAGANPGFNFIDSSLGTNLTRWLLQTTAGNVVFQAVNDAFSSGTNAYIINRGTTYNVANHTWYTSTTAGTPVQNMQLTTSAFSLGSGITSIALAGIQSSAAALSYTCTNTGTGAQTYGAASGLCTASFRGSKDVLSHITPEDGTALAMTMKLDPIMGKYKDSETGTFDHAEHPMLVAEDVESVDRRLAAYDPHGKLAGVRYLELPVILVADVQSLNTYRLSDERDISDLTKRISALESIKSASAVQ